MPVKKVQRRKRGVKKEEAKAEGSVKPEIDIKAVQERQIRLILLWMLLVVLFASIFVFFFRTASNFTYEGMKFQRISMSGLTLYKTTLQFTRQDGNFKFDLYLRNNPKELERIPSNATIVLKKTGFISFEPKISGCYGSNIPALELGQFLGALGMKVKGATTDKNLSEEQSIPFKTCSDATNTTIILLRNSDKNSIEQEGECYILNIAQCDVIPVAEKFIFDTTVQIFNRSKEISKSGSQN